MTSSTRKTLWWYALAGSLGATAFFAYICVIEKLPPAEIWWIYLWPGASMTISLISILALRRCYREEPGAFAGFWQLSIIDLYSVIGFTALWMAFWRHFYLSTFVPIGTAVSLLLGIAFTICLLISARKGFHNSRAKIPYAAGLLFTAMGLLAAGAIALLFSIWMLNMRGRILAMTEFCLFLGPDLDFDHDGVLHPIRVALLLLPVGIFLRILVGQMCRGDSKPA